MTAGYVESGGRSGCKVYGLQVAKGSIGTQGSSDGARQEL